MIRKPQVAGTFYPGSKKELEESVKNYIGKHSPTPAAGIMVPHAGYLYSGKTAGLTYREIQIPETVIIIGPNHTGRGKPVSIMREGRWAIPGAEIEIDLEIAGKLISESRFAENDREAHV
nr:AmmeMemoRadiSam system protein B [Elusimicrobiota bacterium]